MQKLEEDPGPMWVFVKFPPDKVPVTPEFLIVIATWPELGLWNSRTLSAYRKICKISCLADDLGTIPVLVLHIEKHFSRSTKLSFDLERYSDR